MELTGTKPGQEPVKAEHCHPAYSTWGRKWQPVLVFLPRESLAGYNPWGHKESDRTEATWQEGRLI